MIDDEGLIAAADSLQQDVYTLLDSAEVKDKRIAELEAEVERLRIKLHDYEIDAMAGVTYE